MMNKQAGLEGQRTALGPSPYQQAVDMGAVHPECGFCQAHFIPYLIHGMRLDQIWAPRHTPSPACVRQHRPHCACEACF